MTRKQAFDKAQQRWDGGKAVKARLFGADWYRVGYVGRKPGIGGICFHDIGSGPTWEAAFADADERERSKLRCSECGASKTELMSCARCGAWICRVCEPSTGMLCVGCTQDDEAMQRDSVADADADEREKRNETTVD